MVKFIKLTKKSSINENMNGIFNGYTIEGFLQEDIKIGLPLFVVRTNKNGLDSLGIFETSPVQKIEIKPNYSILYTRNSVYKIEYMESDNEYQI